MAHVKEGDLVAVRYRAVASDQRLLASTGTGPALTFLAGGDDVLYGLSHGVIGMQPGEEAVLIIDAEDAFGDVVDAVERALPKSRVPSDVRIGDALCISEGDATIVMWVIDEGAGETWELSSLHPFAGQDLELHIQVVAS